MQERSNPIPPADTIVELIFEEFKKLRSSKMTTRDLVSLMKHKEQKLMSANSISFWEGARDLLMESCEFRAFNELDFFKDFLAYVKQNLNVQEFSYIKAVREREKSKKHMSAYCSTIGRLKGLKLVYQLVEKAALKDSDFEKTVRDRLHVLVSRLEKVDLDLTK
jgi:hypothetical protein